MTDSGVSVVLVPLPHGQFAVNRVYKGKTDRIGYVAVQGNSPCWPCGETLCRPRRR